MLDLENLSFGMIEYASFLKIFKYFLFASF